MRLDWISAENFRCFESRRFDLAERFNLFVGDNGTGKTAILDALAVGVGALVVGFPTKARVFSQDEVRVKPYTIGETPTLEQQYPVTVACEGKVGSRMAHWERRLNSKKSLTTRKTASEIQSIAQQMHERVQNGESVTLPVVCYYGTGRLWVQERRRYKSQKLEKPGSRLRVYGDRMSPTSDEARVVDWWKTKEMAALQNGKPIGVLEAVRGAVTTCVEKANRVYFNIDLGQLMVKLNEGELPLHLLSDGYHSMVAMIADIAIRAATLNPHLAGEAALETPGVVLIDELDLHLHPKWQRRVVEDLMSAFPKIQFAATTHSPFIIQSLRDNPQVKLHNLDDEQAADFVNRSIEDIAELVQGIPEVQRSQRHVEMTKAATEYFHVLQHAREASPQERDQLKGKLDTLLEPFGDNPAYVAFLKMERAAARLGD